MADMIAQGKQPEVLFWVGAAGSYDDRAKKISRAFVKILHAANVDFAVLGTEESSTGDAAKRAGNEFLFQMQAHMNIEVLNGYEVKKIVTCDPHSFNTLKNEYPSLGGKYEVFHLEPKAYQTFLEKCRKAKRRGSQWPHAQNSDAISARFADDPLNEKQKIRKDVHLIKKITPTVLTKFDKS